MEKGYEVGQMKGRTVKRLDRQESEEYGWYERAMNWCIHYHEGQKRADGSHYCFHPIAVSQMLKPIREKTVALLHDILEDTYCSKQNLKGAFPEDIVNSVLVLTNDESRFSTYEEFIQQILDSKDYTAWAVKLADIQHNLMTLDNIEGMRRQKLKDRYTHALHVLTQAQKNEGR